MNAKKLIGLAAGVLLTVGCADSLSPTLPANIQAGGAGFQVLTDTTAAPEIPSGQETTTTGTCVDDGGGAMGSGGKIDETCTDSSAP